MFVRLFVCLLRGVCEVSQLGGSVWLLQLTCISLLVLPPPCSGLVVSPLACQGHLPSTYTFPAHLLHLTAKGWLPFCPAGWFWVLQCTSPIRSGVGRESSVVPPTLNGPGLSLVILAACVLVFLGKAYAFQGPVV